MLRCPSLQQQQQQLRAKSEPRQEPEPDETQTKFHLLILQVENILQEIICSNVSHNICPSLTQILNFSAISWRIDCWWWCSVLRLQLFMFGFVWAEILQYFICISVLSDRILGTTPDNLVSRWKKQSCNDISSFSTSWSPTREDLSCHCRRVSSLFLFIFRTIQEWSTQQYRCGSQEKIHHSSNLGTERWLPSVRQFT